MKIIIYITALICSLLASPVLATETGQISMTDMGLKVTPSPESTLYEGDTWMITPIGNVVSEFLNVCSKARNFRIPRFTEAWKRIPPLYGPMALLC